MCFFRQDNAAASGMAESSFDQTPQDASKRRQGSTFSSNIEVCVEVSRRPSDRASTAAHQVNDQDHQRNDQQQVNQPAGHVEAETQEPQN